MSRNDELGTKNDESIRAQLIVHRSSFLVLSSDRVTHPKSWQAVGAFLVVVWDDEHESYYPLEELRRACPCAGCSGEPDLFGRMAGGAPQRYIPQSFQLRSTDRIGNYALQPNWSDGHTYGIWTFDRLRAFCPCSECRPA